MSNTTTDWRLRLPVVRVNFSSASPVLQCLLPYQILPHLLLTLHRQLLLPLAPPFCDGGVVLFCVLFHAAGLVVVAVAVVHYRRHCHCLSSMIGKVQLQMVLLVQG